MTRTVDPYDKLAAMFLTDGDRTDPDLPAMSSGPIEIVVAGHLPVRGSIWLTPYADTVAQREGATALVRLDGDEPTVEMHAVEADHAELLRETNCRTVREAIMVLGSVVRCWIVRPAADAEPAELLGTQDGGTADRITILSSADQAAVTNVYKLVKELATAARAAGRDLPRLGLAMIGSPREKAALQARRIDATAREHLEVSVPLTLNIAQMGAARSRILRSFPGQSQPRLADVIAWVHTARERGPGAASEPGRSAPPEPLRPAASAPASAAPPPVAPPLVAPPPVSPPPALPTTVAMSAGIERALDYGRTFGPQAVRRETPAEPPAASREGAFTTHIPDDVAPLLEDIMGFPAPGRTATPASPTPASEAPALEVSPSRPERSIKLPPRAAAAVEPKQASPPREPDRDGQPVPLACHVIDTSAKKQPGVAPAHLKPLVARCPGQERIEIALDGSGRLHVLAREEDVRGLPVVQSWVRANRELIAMAHPNETFHPAAPTVAHVFAADPLRVADLHASPLHLHVLTPIDVDGKRAWYAAALNRPQ